MTLWHSTRYIWLVALAILWTPDGINHAVHEWTSSHLAAALAPLSGRKGPGNSALDAWAHEQSEEYQMAVAEAQDDLGEGCPRQVCRVIFHGNAPWNSVLWVDGGKASPVPIVKNSPVLVHDILVGIVDFVGERASRVRLLSDPTVHPAVRVVRSGADVRELIRSARTVHHAVRRNPALMPNPELSAALAKLLDGLIKSLPQPGEIRLAKGELQGAEYPSSPGLLKGVGFNYDFDDEEGGKRDLRTGQREPADQKIALVRPGDLLETSGLDGMFPKGLRVATVETVFPLEEGAISYTILAKTEAYDFPNFEFLTIIPAQAQDPKSPPSPEDHVHTLITESTS